MSKKVLEILAVFFAMLALAFISTYPLIHYLDTAIPYSPFGGAITWNRSGDQMQLLYWFWLVKENFLGSVPFDSNPFEFNMVMPHETTGLNTIPLAFLFMLFSPLGDVTAYNCTILTSYVLTGVFMYLLVFLYSGSRAGAFLAAVIFTFAPSRIRGLAAGHGYGYLYFFYPFIIYYLEKGLRSARISYGFISGLGLVCLAMLEPHFIYYIVVFLGFFIPFRILSSLPDHRETRSPDQDAERGTLSWPVSRSLILLWGAGAAAVVYAQVLFHYRDSIPFFTGFFWWVLGIYPFIPILLSFCFSGLYQRLAGIPFRQGMTVEAASFLPVYLLIPLSVLSYLGHPPDTGFILVAVLVSVLGVKVVLIRSWLSAILKNVREGVVNGWEKVLPVLPLVLSMAGIVIWIMSSKVKKVASTIAAGGRRLDDVGLFSSQLSDVVLPTSNVYIGIIPAVLAVIFLVGIFRSAFRTESHEQFSQEDRLVILFYTVAGFCSYILALGLAFGKSSLYVLFYHYFPFFNYPRVSDRIIILVLFSLAIIAGFMVRTLQQRVPKRSSLGAASLLVFAAAVLQLKDYSVFEPMGMNMLDRGQDIYTYVKKNAGDGRLLEIPLWPGDSHQSSLYQHYIMLDRVPRVNGCSPLVLKEYIETVFEPLKDINQGRLSREQFELLHQLQVKFITVHDNRDVFLPKVSPFVPLTTVRRLQNSPYLEHVPLKNMMYFKTWKGRNSRLYLFRVKSEEEIGDSPQQAWYDMPYFYGVNSRLNHQTGRIEEDREVGKEVFLASEKTDKPGFLVYGPYDVYDAGDYRCYFTIRVQDPGESKTARLEVSTVTDNEGIRILAEKELYGGETAGVYKKEFLDFSLPENMKLEFRVFYYGEGEVRVEKVAVYKKGKEKQLALLEAEKMVGEQGLLVSADNASGGKVVQAVVGKEKSGNMVYGPNKIYEQGRYTARFFLRLIGGQRFDEGDTVALLKVTDGQDLTVYAEQEVAENTLNRRSFIGVDVDFALARDEDLSFQVFFNNTLNLQLDKIEIVQH